MTYKDYLESLVGQPCSLIAKNVFRLIFKENLEKWEQEREYFYKIIEVNDDFVLVKESVEGKDNLLAIPFTLLNITILGEEKEGAG